MNDLWMILIVFAFFLLMWGFVSLCDYLLESWDEWIHDHCWNYCDGIAGIPVYRTYQTGVVRM